MFDSLSTLIDKAKELEAEKVALLCMAIVSLAVVAKSTVK